MVLCGDCKSQYNYPKQPACFFIAQITSFNHPLDQMMTNMSSWIFQAPVNMYKDIGALRKTCVKKCDSRGNMQHILPAKRAKTLMSLIFT